MSSHSLLLDLRIEFNGEVEAVPARPVSDLGPNTFELLASPGLAEGAAVGDIVRTEADGRFAVLRRSGVLAIQVYPGPATDVAAMEAAFTNELRNINGTLDGGIAGIRVYNVRIDVGFPGIEAACNAAASLSPGSKWMYANVYDAKTGEVLPWVADAVRRRSEAP